MVEKISEAELEVLKVLWNENREMSSVDIIDTLRKQVGWEKSTIRTLIHRLTEKGVLIQEKREVYYYFPKITEKEYSDEQTRNFCMKMYKGNAGKLVASLFEQDIIRPEDIEQLKRFWKEGEERHVE
jgi:BlaI family penicillinase repressor